MAAARAVISVLWLLVCRTYADEISQSLDQDVCDTPDCAVKLLQVASRTPEGHALTEESGKKSNMPSTSDSGGICRGKPLNLIGMVECNGLSAYSCLHNSNCDWMQGSQPGSGGAGGGGGYGYRGKCQAKPFNLIGSLECNGLSKWSCSQNSNCEFVIG
ncbi:unnamed protein product [Symbiodinium sp. CCMP2592]|nr:unnamed protein product [Symbiodinium sp. CCMP2592]